MSNSKDQIEQPPEKKEKHHVLKTLKKDFVTLFTSRNFVLMLIVSICSSFSLSMAKTPLTLYGKTIGLSPAEVGMTWGTYYLICLILRPFTGPIIDRCNKKALLVICFVLKGIAYLGYGFSNDATLFYVSRWIDAASFCLATSVFASVATLLIKKEMMGTGISVYQALPALVLMAAPPTSAYIFSAFPAPTVFYIAGAICCLGILAALMLRFPKEDKEAKVQRVAKTQHKASIKNFINSFIYLPTIPVCAMTFFLAVMLTANDTYLLVMAQERGIENAALFFTVGDLLKLIAGLCVGILSDFVSLKKIMIPACLATALSAVLLGAADSLAIILISSVLYFAAQKGTAPVMIKAATMSAPIERRGAAVSTNFFLQDIAGVTSGFMCAALFTAFGYAGMYYALSLFPLIGLALFLLSYKFVFGRIENAQKEATEAE